MDRQERDILSIAGSNGAYLNPRFSPGGQQLAVQIGSVRSEDIWVYHFVCGTLTRLTFNEGQDVTPVWTPDGQRITYSCWRENQPFICDIRADGSGQEKVIYQPHRSNGVSP